MSHAHNDNSLSALERDLALVIDSPETESKIVVSAQIAGRETSIEDAVARSAALLRDAKSPAIIGLNGLSIEGIRAAVTIARRRGAKLLPWPSSHPEASTRLVSQTTSLGNAFASDMILWIGCSGTDSAITQAIVSNQLLSAFLQPDLSTVLNLRRLLKNTSEQSPFGTAKRITAVLAPDAEPRVVSQWHKLANQAQKRHRLAVLQLPARDSANARGAAEAITWLTGVAPTRGGVDLACHPPVGCADAQTLLAANAIDVVLDLRLTPAAPLPFSSHVQRIVFATAHDASAAVSFVVPPLSLGMAARVMRFDGVILNLCDDTAVGVPDAAAQLLATLVQQFP